MQALLIRYAIALAVGLTMIFESRTSSAEDLLVFVSAFAAGDDGAIHAYSLNSVSGQLKLLHRTTDVENFCIRSMLQANLVVKTTNMCLLTACRTSRVR